MHIQVYLVDKLMVIRWLQQIFMEQVLFTLRQYHIRLAKFQIRLLLHLHPLLAFMWYFHGQARSITTTRLHLTMSC